ncbi:MBL fold metallo-hydrolase [Snuella lapsa]|uniref:MBL fold metallo-hydrolase n=1 Tax=Snuella lapsa TaxID=870481 RepID=A0ABP6XL81_9FLAO
MTIKFYGTRGSIPVCENGFQEFGGNTTCLSVTGEERDDILILDSGTGIRKLGKELMQKKFQTNQRIMIAFSHYHWDHIQGFPFFGPAYDSSKDIHLMAYGEDNQITDLKEVFGKQMESIFFPISLDNMGAKFTFTIKKINEEFFPNGRLLVNKHSHPGGAVGYRIEYNNKIFVYCTDIEHGEQLDERVIAFAENADVLVHDAQYTPQELPNFRGWGHSSWEQAIEVAELAGVKKLYLTHHDPEHNDDFLKREELKCQKRFANCFMAREGDEIKL